MSNMTFEVNAPMDRKKRWGRHCGGAVVLVLAALLLAGCDTGNAGDAACTAGACNQLQTFFQDFARQVLAAFLL